MPFLEESYDIAVVGAGHAGCEAALAAARLGFETIMFTVSVDSIALMPCNPNIGGSSKGHLVRELDALGGAVKLRCIDAVKAGIRGKKLAKLVILMKTFDSVSEYAYANVSPVHILGFILSQIG